MGWAAPRRSLLNSFEIGGYRSLHSHRRDEGLEPGLEFSRTELEQRFGACIQLRRTGKGCLSYLIGSQDQAAVIDASVAPEVYLESGRPAGWKITDVLDTHVHADHLSRSRQLSELCGAIFGCRSNGESLIVSRLFETAKSSRWARTIDTASHSRAHAREYLLSLGWQGPVYRLTCCFWPASGGPTWKLLLMVLACGPSSCTPHSGRFFACLPKRSSSRVMSATRYRLTAFRSMPC